jgi:hypothetical protein
MSHPSQTLIVLKTQSSWLLPNTSLPKILLFPSSLHFTTNPLQFMIILSLLSSWFRCEVDEGFDGDVKPGFWYITILIWGLLTYQRPQAHLPSYQTPNKQPSYLPTNQPTSQPILRAAPNTFSHHPTKPKPIKMVHPFLIDQKAYLDRISSSSTSSTSSTSSQPIQGTYEQFKQSTTSTTHLFGSVTPRSSRLSVTSQTSQQDERDLEMERKKKQERRRGVIGRLF